MLLQNGIERILDFLGLEDIEAILRASVSLQVEKASGVLLPCSIVVNSNIENVCWTAVDVGHCKRVLAS